MLLVKKMQHTQTCNMHDILNGMCKLFSILCVLHRAFWGYIQVFGNNDAYEYISYITIDGILL